MKRPRVHFEKGPVGWLQRYALFAYDHPISLFFGILVTIIFFGALGGGLGFRLTESSNEWEIKTNKHVKQNAAINEALDELSEETVQEFYSIEVDELEIWFTYQAKDEGRNIFTEENLLSMREVENEVMSGEYADLCLLNYNVTGDPVCQLPLSVLHNFFAYDIENPEFGDWLTGDPQESIEAGINNINQNIFLQAFFLDNEYNENEGFFQTEFSRSRFQLGLPIDFSQFRAGREALERGDQITEYTNSNLDEEDQLDEIYDEFLEDLEERLFDLLDMEAPAPLTTDYMDFGEIGNLEVLFWNPELQAREFTRVVMMDFMWAGLSILSVWIYMLIHLGSVFLSLIGIIEIFFSFPVALFFYKPVFQIDYFSEMNLLVIFILLGIGADDIFVFTDAYKQSASVPGIDPSLQGRLMYSSSRASKAVFVTSFTTMAAFFATAVSPLMPMQAFGIFAALCIIFLFAINVFLMPPTLILYAGYTPYLTKWVCPCCIPDRRPEWVNTYCPCCSCCHVEIDETFFLPLAEAPEQKKAPQGGAPQSGGYPNPEMEMTSATNRDPNAAPSQPVGGAPQNQGPIMVRRQSSLADADLHELRSIEKFFYGPFFIFLQRAKYAILLIGTVLFCVGIGYITTFQTPDEAEEWFPDDHAYNRFLDYIDPQKTPFRDSTEDNVAEVFLVWGLDGMDPSGRNIWIGDDFGDLEYDEEFDLTPRANQQFLLDVCPRVRQAPCGASACAEPFLIRIDRDSDDELQQKCWIEDFDEWLRDERDLSIPLDPDQFIPELVRYLDIEAKFVEYGEDIGYSNSTGELRFVMFSFDTTFRPPASSSRTNNVIDEWEDFIDALNDDATEQGLIGINNGFESGRDAWLWPSTSDALISGAISGLVLVFVLAFVVLNVASGNVMISVIAVLTIAGIVATVMGVGIRAIMDWDLGTAESITIVILIGFSMDYTLHLSDAYMESPHTNREDRTRDAMTHLGISVTAGAFTTLISGLFLWATILIFFQKFAFNVTATVFTSFIFSIFFFPSLCLTIGPQGDWGSWTTMYRYCRKKKDDWWAN